MRLGYITKVYQLLYIGPQHLVQHIIMSVVNPKEEELEEIEELEEGDVPKKKVPFINQISLGDILKIESPNQVDFHERTFLVTYVDS